MTEPEQQVGTLTDEVGADDVPRPIPQEIGVPGAEEDVPGGDRKLRRVSDLRAAWSRWTWTIGAGALVVRLLAIAAQPLRLFNDDADYQRLAISLATGHGWGVSHVAPGGGPTAFRPPLFPLVLAGVYRVFGVHLIAARLFEAVLGAATVVLLIALTWLLWGRKIALTVGVLAALFPPLIIASTSLMSESIAIPLEIGSLLAIFVYRRTAHARWAWLSGGLLGLLVLARTEAIVLAIPLVFLAIGSIAKHRKRSTGEHEGFTEPTSLRASSRTWRVLVAPLVVIVAMVIVLAPWEIRDRVVMGAWIPLTTQGGYVLSGTYNHTSATDPRYPAAWRPGNYDPTIARLFEDHPHANEVRLDKLLETSAVDYVRAHPSYLATVIYQNTLRLFDIWSVSTAQASTYSSYGYSGTWGELEQLSALMALALALAGICLRRGRSDLEGRRIPLAYWAVPVILWVSTVFQEAFPRLRALIDPFLIELSAVALVAMVSQAMRRFPKLREALGR